MSKNCSSRSLNCHPILSQQNILLAFRFCFGAGPACKHESNLVDEIRNVVKHVEECLISASKQVAEKVAKRVDGPTRRDDHAHVLEGSREGLVENEEPAEHTHNEGRPCWQQEGLTEVSEHEHDDGADQESPEHAAAYWLACCLEDQVEFDHLQGDRDAPIHVPVD